MEAYPPGATSRMVVAWSTITVRAARPDDLPVVRALLAAAALPLDGVGEAFEHGIVATEGDLVVGAAAIEPYGTDGLLRSVVVDPDRRGTGLGRLLVDAAEDLAVELGVVDLYLLTETAADWFPRLGYKALPREAAPAAVAGSVEFTVACAETGLLMHRRLAAPG